MARKDKNLKKLVRARMEKTGESYMAARRQVIEILEKRAVQRRGSQVITRDRA